MPVLPSGRVVGIMHERARYHAARLGLKVTPYTPHRQLHALIDVVFADARDGREMWEKHYTFSGHTLADSDWIARWPKADRELFQRWLGEKAQLQEIEAARRRVLAESTPRQIIEYDYPERLFSLLERHLQNLELQSASVDQWRHTILKLRQKGVREEEIHWSGVMTFLDIAKAIGRARIGKAELLERLNFTNIRLSMLNELEPDPATGLAFQDCARLIDRAQLEYAGIWVPESDLGVVRLREPTHRYRIGCVRPRGVAGANPGSRRWFALAPHGEAIQNPSDGLNVFYESRDAAVAAANAHALHRGRVVQGNRPREKYAYMSLDGGSDYREWLVTLPDYQPSHFISHFMERNVLLHMRTKQRIDSRGRKLLFIEEIQSDWHQAAARYGYDNRWNGCIPVAPFRKEWAGLALKLLILHAIEQGCDGIAWTDGDTQELRYGKPLAPVRRLYDREIPQALQRLVRPWDLGIGETTLRTRRTNLQPVREQGRWRIRDADGKMQTRARFNLAEVTTVVARHSRSVELKVPALYFSEAMRKSINEQGLPLFGERL